MTSERTLKSFRAAQIAAFQEHGSFTLSIYNFRTRVFRRVGIIMPPGKPQAILGLDCSLLPMPEGGPSADGGYPTSLEEAGGERFVKGWRRRDGMFISCGPNDYYPVFAPLTSENSDVFVKVSPHHCSRVLPGHLFSERPRTYTSPTVPLA